MGENAGTYMEKSVQLSLLHVFQDILEVTLLPSAKAFAYVSFVRCQQ